MQEVYKWAARPKIRDRLSNELKSKMIMICLKIDSARRLSRSVIGINIQFIESGKFDLRPLAIKEVTFSQTGEYIKEFTINVPLDLRNQSIQTIYQERQ